MEGIDNMVRLPLEMFIEISKYLDCRDILRLAGVCTKFRDHQERFFQAKALYCGFEKSEEETWKIFWMRKNIKSQENSDLESNPIRKLKFLNSFIKNLNSRS